MTIPKSNGAVRKTTRENISFVFERVLLRAFVNFVCVVNNKTVVSVRDDGLVIGNSDGRKIRTH